MRYAFALFAFSVSIQACASLTPKQEAMACYSGGVLVWKGLIQAPSWTDTRIKFVDVASGLSMTFAADCFVEEIPSAKQ